MIQIDENGWINPVCPHCEFVMEFNYHRWTTSSRPEADLNMYCRECHYAISIKPSTTDKNLLKMPVEIECYNESGEHPEREYEEDRCVCREDNININCQECF